MHLVRISVRLIVVVFCLCTMVYPREQTISVTGQLTRVAAIGGESTGWAIQLGSQTTIDGKQVHSVEVETNQEGELQRLNNQVVKATGIIVHRHGVERGDRPVLEISSIEKSEAASKPTSQRSDETRVPVNLTGTEWLLTKLPGTEVLQRTEATLAFPESGKVAGNGSCNRFFGSVQISGTAMKFGALGATRMACPANVMMQEAKYLNALQQAERFERKGSELLVYCKGFEKPLHLTRKHAATRE